MENSTTIPDAPEARVAARKRQAIIEPVRKRHHQPLPPDDRRYVDLKKFRQMFGFSKSFVYRQRALGVFTRLKQGGRSRWIVAEGEAYMRSLPTDRRAPPKLPRPGKGKGRRS
jgi:hypothetical protein